MTLFTKDQEVHIGRLAAALKAVKVTEREIRDMRELYLRTNGIPIDDVDSGNRPRSKEILSSSTLGSKIKRAIGASASHYGMNFIGFGKNSKWFMRDDFRAAIDLAQLFGPVGVVADARLPDEEVDEGYDEEEAAVDEAIEEILDDEALTDTERDQLIKARVGQGIFRSNVCLVSPVCRLTGVSDVRFLRASHIKPWRVCTNTERLDGSNGLMLSPHIDHLFDQGYISFEDDGSAMLSTALPQELLGGWSLQVDTNIGKLTSQQVNYMAHHRKYVFKLS